VGDGSWDDMMIRLHEMGTDIANELIAMRLVVEFEFLMIVRSEVDLRK